MNLSAFNLAPFSNFKKSVSTLTQATGGWFSKLLQERLLQLHRLDTCVNSLNPTFYIEVFFFRLRKTSFKVQRYPQPIGRYDMILHERDEGNKRSGRS